MLRHKGDARPYISFAASVHTTVIDVFLEDELKTDACDPWEIAHLGTSGVASFACLRDRWRSREGDLGCSVTRPALD